MKILDDLVERQNYLMSYRCDNCYKDFTQTFPKGTRASQGECPHCGCRPRKNLEVDYRKEF